MLGDHDDECAAERFGLWVKVAAVAIVAAFAFVRYIAA